MKQPSLIAIQILIALHDLHNECVIGSLRPVPKKMIGARVGYGVDYIEQLLNPLKKAGYVSAVRGVNGGFCLKKPLRMIFMSDVVRLFEGQPNPDELTSVEKAVRHLTLGKSAGTTLWQIRELSRSM